MASVSRELPRGVYRIRNKFAAQYKGQYLGWFSTAEDAHAKVIEAQALSPMPQRKQLPEFVVDGDISEVASKLCWVKRPKGHLQVSIHTSAGRHTVQMGNWAWMMYGGPILGPGFVVDHINRNPGDNRRCNLRLITVKGNILNRAGQNVIKKKNRWWVRVGEDGKIFSKFFEEEDTARIVAFHVKQKAIESEVVFAF